LKKKKEYRKEKKTEFSKEDWSVSKVLMSLKNTTFKYKEYEMEVEGAYDNVVLALNANDEIEIVDCQVCL